LAEACISEQIARETPRLIGAQVELTAPGKPEASAAEKSEAVSSVRSDALLFGEAQARIIISVAAINAVKVLAQAKLLGVPATRIGTVGGTALQIKAAAGTLSAPVSELHDLWWNSIARAMGDARKVS
jgi:phosphoribosylformylglycinamidine synthase